MKRASHIRLAVGFTTALIYSWITCCQADPLARTNWFNSGGTMVASPGHLVVTPTNATDYYATMYFAPTNNPLTLAQPGNQLKLTWRFTPSGVFAYSTQTPLIIGLVNTPDSNRLTADGAPGIANYSGYATAMNAYIGNPLFAWLRQASRADPGTANYLFQGDQPEYSGWNVPAQADNYSDPSCTNGIPYTLTMTLTRDSANGLVFDSRIENTFGCINHSSYVDASPNTFSFNTGVIYAYSQLYGTFDTTAFDVNFNYGSSAIVRDSWSDGDRTDPAPPVYSEQGTDADNDGDIESAWFISPGGTLTASPGHLITITTNSPTYWTTYFTTPTNPVTLTHPGDQIKVTWAFTPSGVVGFATETPLHVALMNSQMATRLTTDDAPGAAHYAGYASFMGVYGSQLFYNLTLAGWTDANAVLPMFQTGYFNQFAGWTPLAANDNYATGPEDVQYTYVMTATRKADASLDIVATMTDNSDFTNQASANDPNPNTYTFDTVSIFQDEQMYGTFDTTLFQVDFYPLPALQTITASSQTIQISWSTRSNLTYQVQCCSDLTQSGWSNLGNPITATNSTATASDPINPGSQRFYRVALLP
jgi:hypothetical protein